MPLDCISVVSEEQSFLLEVWAFHRTILAKNFRPRTHPKRHLPLTPFLLYLFITWRLFNKCCFTDVSVARWLFKH